MTRRDPRLSIEERYGNLWQVYFMALNEANDLVQKRYLLPEDANNLINQLLNNLLTNKVLPTRGTFDPGMLPAGIIAIEADEVN